MKLFMASLVLIFAESACASEMCNLEVQGGLRITKSELEFSQDEVVQYKIANDQTLLVNGKPVKLNQKQQLLITQYAVGIRAMVPEVRQLTLEGIDLGAEAMKIVFDEFLGPDNSAAQEANQSFSLLKKDIEKSFTGDSPIYFNRKGGHEDNFFGNDFESRVNNIMETSGKEIAWSVMKAVGTSILSLDVSMESRMNKFGEKMEFQMKRRSEKLEKVSGTVCRSVVLLDLKEEEMKRAIPEVSEFNFLQLKTSQPAAK
jgi:hypothetical protein